MNRQLLVVDALRHSETAFVRAPTDGDWDLRWFTPEVEVDLCGHATLASAHALLESGRATSSITFHTRSGALRATATEAGIELDFPATPAERAPAPDGLLDALGTTAVATARIGFYALVELADAASVRALAPDILHVRLDGDRVRIAGSAVTVIEGTLRA